VLKILLRKRRKNASVSSHVMSSVLISFSSEDFFAQNGSSSGVVYSSWKAGLLNPGADAETYLTYSIDNGPPTGIDPLSLVTQHIRMDIDSINNPLIGDRNVVNYTGTRSVVESPAGEVKFGVVVPVRSSSSSSISSSSSSCSSSSSSSSRSCSSSSSQYANYNYVSCGHMNAVYQTVN